MIIKSFEIDKKKISEFKVFLIYGENEGLKKEIINKIKKNHSGKEVKYDETQVLKNTTEFYNQIKNNSLFEEKKIFLLERCTDKISETVMEICEDVTEDLIIINCGLLEKKSKLRKNIEDSKKAVIIPTYKDNSQSLINIANTFFKEKKINISHETLNLLVSRCNGDRGFLKLELEKISNYLSDKRIISLKEISTLTNLSENYSASELVDASLSKNVKKTCQMLVENNYSNEDTFLILRVFLQKTKKILSLLENLNTEIACKILNSPISVLRIGINKCHFQRQNSQLRRKFGGQASSFSATTRMILPGMGWVWDIGCTNTLFSCFQDHKIGLSSR